MQNLSINELIEMQNKLQNRMKDKWMPISPANGHFSLLWMYEELGEVAAIKKNVAITLLWMMKPCVQHLLKSLQMF